MLYIDDLKNHPSAFRSLTTQMSDQASHYARWLAAGVRRPISSQQQEDTNKYISESLTPVMINGREVSLFAPFRYEFSAFRVITPMQVILLSIIMLIYISCFFVFHLAMIVTSIAIIILIYLSDFFLNFILSIRTLNVSAEEHIDEAILQELVDAEWPRYTILCPLYREVEILPQFVQAMQSMDYPAHKLQIL